MNEPPDHRRAYLGYWRIVDINGDTVICEDFRKDNQKFGYIFFDEAGGGQLFLRKIGLTAYSNFDWVFREVDSHSKLYVIYTGCNDVSIANFTFDGRNSDGEKERGKGWARLKTTKILEGHICYELYDENESFNFEAKFTLGSALL